MFNPGESQDFDVEDGQIAEMENVDGLLNYDNNEFMSSEFFDTIRSVESGIQDDFLSSPTSDFTALSDTSSHNDGYISPGNDLSETEQSSVFTDDSVSPERSLDAIDDSIFDFLQPVTESFTIESSPVIINQSKPRKLIIQNPNRKTFVNKQIANAPLKKIGKKQILKVQPLPTNCKPIILPCGLKSIKILNASDLTDRIHVTLPRGAVCRRKIVAPRVKDEENTSTIPVNELSEVKLTNEEKRLLDKEGIQMPAFHPLTKMEDRELKRIRRKIRNKISAQDSRKRKKEYVDGLEDRVRRGSEENKNLMQRVKELQKKNKTLMAHITKLQSLIFSTTSSKATPSTCFMIVLISVLLVSLPNLKLSQMSKDLSTEQEQISTSRSLLSTKKDEDVVMEEFFVFNKDEENDNENNTESDFYKAIEEMESKYDGFNFDRENTGDDNFFNSLVRNIKNLFSNSNERGGGGSFERGEYQNKKGFIEPDIDGVDDNLHLEPPIKRIKLDYHHQSDENFVPNKVISTTVHTGETKNK